MPGMQLSGLTGFDSATIVKQLMSVERLAGNSITKAKTTVDGLIGALQRLNSLTKTMADAAKALVPDSITKASAWQSTTATSSNKDFATAVTSSSATPGSLTFAVTSVAQAGAGITGAAHAAGDVLNGGAAFSLSIAKGTGTAVTVDVAAGAKLADVAAAINAAPDLGVKATMVQVEEGSYKLELESTTTGANTGLSVTDTSGALGGYTTIRGGKDTVLHVGDAATGYDIRSSATTVKDVLPGVSITAVKADAATSVTVDVKSDVTAIGDKVKSFVDATNEVLSNIRVNSKYDADSKTSGVLNGDSATRDLSYRLQGLLSDGNAAALAAAGVQLTKDGTLSFDKAKFEAAYAKDPAAVEKALTDTATKVADLGKQATNSADGLLTVRINGEQALLRDYTKQIQRFEDRMALKEQTLSRQFSALESLLSKLQSQGQWLQGQLKSLPTTQSSN